MTHRHRRRALPRRSTPAGQHLPVMLAEVLAVLQPQLGDIAVDCTLGFGGHASEILKRVGSSGRLIGLEWDREHLPLATANLETTGLPFSVHHSNFAALPAVLTTAGVEGCDVLVADLGMSSMQLDDAERGFSYVRDGPLDMRMDRARGRSAADILAEIQETELAAALRELGDEEQADIIAAALVAARQRQPLTRTAQVAQIIAEAVGEGPTSGAKWTPRVSSDRWKTHPAARTFQALRLLVNRELANLQQLLRVLPETLRPGGRATIISFHSGEDRLVKASFRAVLHRGRYSSISEEPMRPSESEKLNNPRARSAKLRWANAPGGDG